MKADKAGNLFASGPGGIWIFNKSGKLVRKDQCTGICIQLFIIG
jgi:gluconolactonase